MSNENEIYTIGHSNYEIDKLLDLLKQYEIEVVADVRSSPYSSYSPQFNKEILKKALNGNGIKYLFFGAELGARPNDQGCYLGDHVNFEKLAKSAIFQQGIDRLFDGMEKYRIVLLCSEKEPINCHRTILVSRVLSEKGVKVRHILENGETIDQTEVENKLMDIFKIEPDLFDNNRDILVEDAYKRQEENISYVTHLAENI